MKIKPIFWIILACLLFWYLIIHAIMGHSQEVNIDMEVIKIIESGGNPKAYNKYSGAIGLYQITDICRRDYIDCTGDNVTREMLYRPWVNYKVAKWYIKQRIPQLIRHKGYEVNIDNVLIAYNAGVGYVGKKSVPKETREYIKKYHKLKGE